MHICLYILTFKLWFTDEWNIYICIKQSLYLGLLLPVSVMILLFLFFAFLWPYQYLVWE